MNDLDRFQSECATTAIYRDKLLTRDERVNYCLVGLAGEVGEACNKWKKRLRQDLSAPTEGEIIDELSDCMWYIALALDELGEDLSGAAEVLLDKLRRRKEEGKLQGSGDNR